MSAELKIAAEPNPPVVAGGGLRVLVVDDEPHVCTYLRTMLTKLGHGESTSAESGEAALRLYRDLLPDAVLLDIHMPYMGGMEILGRLVELDPDAIVIMVTTDAAKATIQNAGARGASGYILKHLPPARLQEALAEALSEIAPRER